MNQEPTPPDLAAAETGTGSAENPPELVELFSEITATHRTGPTSPVPDSAPPESQTSASSIPTELGRFRQIEVVKSGGFGIVCRAQDSQDGRVVALKFPRQEKLRDRSDLQLFVDEANRAMELDHPGIVKTYAVEESNGLLAIVQEFIDGSDLRSEQTALTNHQVIATLIAKIADALGYAHRRGVYHRDLKPANILLDQHGNPYITDFGLALHEREQLFLPRQRCGTPHYMPPEQVAGLTRRLDGRSDIWSLGVILYELLTKRRPFQGANEHEIYDQIEHNDPRPPRQIDPSIDRELQRICLKCLERQQRDRYPTADDLAEDLRHWIAQPVLPRPKSGQRFVPRGLRAFTADDADFFLELLPGSRDRNGLPNSLKFWLNRIVSPRSQDLLTPVGVIFGPSGSGKSSFLRAGLVPLLPADVVTVMVDCSPGDTEARLLKLLTERVENGPAGIGLVDLCAGISQGLWRPKGKSKFLIVLDQFEQRLSRGDDFGTSELVRALRFCDGQLLQAILLCRDDFYMQLSRFADGLGMDLREGDNAQAIDLFDRKHARWVLIKYGQVFGQLPDQAVEVTAEQGDFLSTVINELSVADSIVCVQLVMFAEMFRERPWTLDELRSVGGVAGIGEKFLDAMLGPASRDKRMRSLGGAAQKVLEALLPAQGSDIRSGSKTEVELRLAAGLQAEPESFATLIKSLDGQLKLITRVEASPRSAAPDSDLPPVMFQLAHDTMIPSIRHWVDRQTRRTPSGRAGQRLGELGQQVVPGRAPRYLPSHWEWLSWQWLLRTRMRSPGEQAVWQAAGRRFVRDLTIMVAGLMLVAVAAGSWTVFASQQAQRRWVSGQIEQLLIAQPENLPEILTHLDNQAGLVVPQLRLLYQTHPQGSPARLRAALGLVPHDPQVRGDLMDAVLSVDTLPDQLKVIAGRLHIGREASPETWSAIYEDPTEDSRRRFRAFVVEVIHGPTNPRWAIWAPVMVEAFTAEPSSTWRPWLELLKPARAELLPAFKDLLDRDLLNPEPLALGIVALHPSGSAAVDYGLSKLAVWKAAAFRAMLTAITVHGYNREFTRALRRRLADEPDPWAGAAMSVALAGCADHGPLVQGYAEETESPVAIHAVNASLPNRLNFNVLRKIYEEQNLGALQDTNLRRSVLMASALQAPALVDTSLRTWLQEVALHHVVHDPDACCFSAAELILRRLGQDPMKTGRPQRRERSNPEGVLGNVLIDQSGLAFSLLPAPEPNAESRRLAVCNTELTLQEILTYLDQTPAAKIEFGGPQQVQRLDASGEPILEVPFENKRRRTDLALVYDYCNALSRQNQLPESEWCYPLLFRPEDVTQILVNREAAGFRLLTSQEWPWANRTSESLLKLVPPDGPIMLNYAWTFENANFAPQATGRRLPNAQGLFDMFGNVEEVCHSMTVDDAGFYAFGKTVRAQISALNSKPSGIGDQPLPANNLYTAYTGFRICRTVRTAN